jgi:hypothetical protein
METEYLYDREIFRDVELENMIQDYCDETRTRLDLVAGFAAGKKLVYGRRK